MSYTTHHTGHATAEAERPFGRAAQFAVVPIGTVRALNIRSDAEVIEAQKSITPDVLSALEELVNTARAGRLEANSALSVAALWW